jgi:3-hydroxyisobutyrate dehydrogenase
VSAATEGRARVGLVGLGNMGWPMAHNLAEAGFPLTVGDADPALRERFASEHGCEAAASPADFAACEVVVTMLPNDKIVADVVLEWEGGLAENLPAGAVILDMSSSGPTATRALGEALAPLGVGLVDAPVSGGVPRAETGTLSLMVGGNDEAAIEKAMPVLEVLGEKIFRTGGLGTGHALKALNNFLAAASYAAATEALLVGEEFGLDPEVMFEVINTSTGRSFVSEIVIGENVVTGDYATGFALALLAKDVGIAAALAETQGADAPVLSLVAERWAAAADSAPAGADHSETHRQWWPEAVAAGKGGGS